MLTSLSRLGIPPLRLDWPRFLPFLRWRNRVNKQSLRDDLIAGLTGALVALPQGVAFATIAGMPPEYGLYAGMIPAIIAALFGSSWHLVSGPTTAASIVLFSVLSPHAEPGSAQYVSLALTLTFLVGLIQLVMGLARMGTLVNFISHSVVTGFTAGAAILIATNQVKHFFGLEIARGTSFSDTWSTLFHQLDQVQPGVTAVAMLTLVLGIAVKQLSAEVALHDRGHAGRLGCGGCAELSGKVCRCPRWARCRRACRRCRCRRWMAKASARWRPAWWR